MAYLPPDTLIDTRFPRAFQKDLRQQIRMVEDMYRRMYPVIDYHVQLKAVTSVCDAEGTSDSENMDPTTVVGESGTTVFDPLWGEPVPASMGSTGWVQPHGNAAHSAVDARGVFDTPVRIHARIQREAKDRVLKRLGFDKIRDILVFIPLSMLDSAGITVENGDEFEWDGERFQVLMRRRAGYWKNTNVRLYIAINAEHTRLQSS